MRRDPELVVPAADETPMDGIAAVEARIQEIMGRLQSAPIGGGVLGAGEVQEVSEFADVLAAAEATSSPPPSSSGTLNDAGVDPTTWSRDFLERLGLPLSAENIRAVNAWQQAEGTRARFNPLATTQGGFDGTTNLNSVGVKNYASYEDGLAANIRAITNGRYENVLAALRRGNNAEDVAQAIADGPWGSGDLVLRILRQQ